MQKEHFVSGEPDRDYEGRDNKPEIIELQAVGVPERKRLGEAVEAAFLAKATMLGFPVLKPWGDSRPYDFAVESGRRLWRVQVKCATSHRGTRCSARAAGSGPLYTLDDLDFLAAYVIKKNLWYVVPADAFVPRATVHFNYGPQSQGMFEIYRETWCLLTCSARAGQRRYSQALPMRGDASAVRGVSEEVKRRERPTVRFSKQFPFGKLEADSSPGLALGSE
jgi:PD-(D/E)XK endonuclease